MVISQQRLLDILGSVKGAKIIGLTYQSEGKTRSGVNAGRIQKVSRYSVMINARYDRKKAKELGIDVGDVEVKDVPWKEHVAGPVYRHRTNGQQYIEYYPSSGATEYALDGKPTTYDEVKDMLTPPRGGVPYRLVKIENVRQAVIDGTTYQVV